jgi:hypothetical protein
MVNDTEIEELIRTNTIHNVQLLETRAVRNYSGGSVRVMKGVRIGGGQSVSQQIITHIATGDLVLAGEKVFFEGTGQSRTIDIKKINRVTYFNDAAGIRISVSNRQKTMEFRFPNYQIADSKRIANAIVKGEQQVTIQKPIEKKSGCYVATCVYGSYEHEKVKVLRNYRDTKLSKSYLGRLFIKTYYAISPTVVKYLGNNKSFKKFNKKILDKIINKIRGV